MVVKDADRDEKHGLEDVLNTPKLLHLWPKGDVPHRAERQKVDDKHQDL